MKTTDDSEKLPKGIYKRGSVYWVRYAGLDGKVVFQSTKSSKLDKAESFLADRKAEIRVGIEPQIKRIHNFSFKQLSDEYNKWIEGRQASAKVKGYIIGELNSRFGNVHLKRFNTMLVEQLQTDIIRRGFKNGYNNKVLNVFKHMFTKAVEWEMVEADVLKRIRKVKLLREDSRLRYLESKEQCQALIESCDSHLRPIVIMSLNTGLSKGNVLKLKWSNIDFQHDLILVDMTKNGERLEISMNQALRETLLNIPRRIDGGYVFYDPRTNKPYNDIKNSFASACRRAGLKDFHFHDLRHTVASHMIMGGADLQSVQELLGHKDIKMTLRYAHLAPSHKVRAVEILDSTINNAPTIQKLYNRGIAD